MCESGERLKLCTCDEAELKDPDWELWRHDPTIEAKHLRGRVFPPRWDKLEKALQQTMAEALNAENCFDFDYTPQESDVLALRVGKTKWFRYRFDGRAWKLDTSHPFTPWRTQMVHHSRGKLG